eukprot:NODE_2861_length_442_cov_288.117048_g2374_i0.p2 GENE.NODE_2861_length_442_cov_288.117048_g2374_i0~~NODE_2861_length_442_cov_288.117048_g2374_i0.p2  ORF type:complete len:55 (+),score=13.88 NODE_2861_length_442_cov_288.117048_g2374_i0:126-290(+)
MDNVMFYEELQNKYGKDGVRVANAIAKEAFLKNKLAPDVATLRALLEEQVPKAT